MDEPPENPPRSATFAGAALSAASAVAASSPVVSTTLAFLGPVVADVLSRRLSGRQRGRTNRVLTLAAEQLAEANKAGMEVRDDGFFRRDHVGRAPADELVEGVLVVAQNTYEERKLKHIAVLLAYVACSEGMSALAANRFLAIAEHLSWTQYVLLAAVGRKDNLELPDVKVGHVWSTESWAVQSQLYELQSAWYIQGRPDPNGRWPSWPSERLRDHALTAAGSEVHRLLGLEDITSLEIAAVLSGLEGAPPPSPPT